MKYSALVVSSAPGRFPEMLKAIESLSNVEIHHKDEKTCRCIVIIEGEDIGVEMDKFKEISALDEVVDASLVAHNFEESAEITPIQDLTRLN